MNHQQATGSPRMMWIRVTDDRGRTRLEIRWVTTPPAAPAAPRPHAA